MIRLVQEGQKKVPLKMMRYRFNGFELDDQRRLLVRGSNVIEVGQLTFDLILYLVSNRHRVVTRVELQEELWKGKATRPSTIPTAIGAARKALKDSASRPKAIQTIYGRGYRFVAAASVEAKNQSSDDGLRVSPGFFGREVELREVWRGIDSPCPDETRLILISGEAGIGKTRLLDEVSRLAREHGYRLAMGLCSEIEGAPAFWPWRRVLEEIGSQDLWHSLRELRRPVPNSVEEAGAARFGLFDQVARKLSSDSDRGVVVVIDDLHCADIPSLRLLEFIAVQARPPKLRIVCAHRAAIDEGRETALRRIGGFSTTETIELSGLSRMSARQLIVERATFPLSKELETVVTSRAGGNPLLLRQMVSQLNGAMARLGESALLEEARRVGPGLRWAVRARFDELSEPAADLLSVSAVIGREFDVSCIAQVTGVAEDSVLELLEEPRRLEVITRTADARTFCFSHVLFQEVIYEDLNPRRRAVLHRRVLEALERRHGDLKEDVACVAARHCLALGSSAQGSLRVLQEAARWSEENLGFEEAVAYLSGALRMLHGTGAVDPAVRGEILVQLGGALRRSGDRKGAEGVCKKATALARVSGNAALFCRAALAYAPGFFALEAGVVDGYLIGSLEEAWGSAERCPLTIRSSIAGRLAVALYWSDDVAAREALGEEAVALAEASGNDSARVAALLAREVSRWGPSGAGARADLAAWAAEHASSTGDRETELVSRLYRLTSLLQLGRFDDAWREMDLFSRKAAASVHGGALWYTELLSALRAMMRGEWDVAEGSAREMRRMGDRVQDRNAENCHVIHEAYREIECGSEVKALACVESQAPRFPRVKSYQCGRAYLCAATGDVATARRLLRAAVTERGLLLPRSVEWMIGAALLAEAAVLLRDKRSARVIFEELSRHEDEYVVVVFSVAVWRPVSYFLGRLAGVIGLYEEAERLFGKARALSGAVDATPWLAHVEFGWAEMLRVRAWPGDGRRARELALIAEDRAQHLGMRPLLGRIREFLWGKSRGEVQQRPTA